MTSSCGSERGSRLTLLAEATWTDLPERPTVLVPVGSIEQHGPHLPLETDALIATAVARRVAEKAGAYVTPTICIGASGEHRGFPGLVSIGTETLTLVLVETVRSLSDWAGKVVLINAHGGNAVAIQTAVTQLKVEGHEVSSVACVSPQIRDAHAGRSETSLIMYISPWLVRAGRFQRGNLTPIRRLMPALRTHGLQSVSPNGVLGDPHGASADEGAMLLSDMVTEALRVM